MYIPRIMIAATGSGSGKTMITCSLLGALKKMNIDVAAFKCGPDYIDPMFHRTVLDIPSENLDTYFTGEEITKEIFEELSKEHEMAVMEGVMGLYDGAGGVSLLGSSYELACVTDTPIMLVIDTHGMGRSVVPVIAGMLSYDTKKLIKGVILNRVSKGFFNTLSEIIKKELDIEVFGYFENKEELAVSSRHLGLTLPSEIDDIKAKLNKGAEYILESVDIERIIKIAKNASDIQSPDCKTSSSIFNNKGIDEDASDNKKYTLAVARDEAFCFYYEANLRMFKERGVDIKYFSPVHDTALPEKCDGIILGGGYPELYAKALSENKSMLESIRSAIEKGIPSLAECGGFMYLHSEITDDKGNTYPLAGVINEKISYIGKPVRFGYIEIMDKNGFFLPDGIKIKGHEFHYYDSSGNGEGAVAVKPVTNRSWECCHTDDNHFWGFPHLYYPSCPEFVESFIDKMRRYSIT